MSLHRHLPGRRLARRLLTAGLAAGVAVALSACGSSSSSSGSSTSAASSSAASSAAGSSAAGSTAAGSAEAGGSGAAAASFPVEITNAFGTTVIPAAPERVVVIGYTEVDTVLALGVVPVGFQDFGLGFANGVGPWAEPLLNGETPAIFTTSELNFEQIAALQPDLIIGLNRGVTEADYAQLTAIAPTLVRPAEYTDYGVPPMVQATLIGQALGKDAEIAQLGADVEDQVAAAAAANPEFEGKTFSAVWPRPEGAGWFAWTAIDPRSELLSALGLTESPTIAALGDDAFYVEISKENTADINADVIVAIDVNAQQATVLADPLYTSLPAAQGGNVAWITDPSVIGALSYGSVLSLPYALDAMVPDLAAAVAGSGRAAVTTTG